MNQLTGIESELFETAAMLETEIETEIEILETTGYAECSDCGDVLLADESCVCSVCNAISSTL